MGRRPNPTNWGYKCVLVLLDPEWQRLANLWFTSNSNLCRWWGKNKIKKKTFILQKYGWWQFIHGHERLFYRIELYRPLPRRREVSDWLVYQDEHQWRQLRPVLHEAFVPFQPAIDQRLLAKPSPRLSDAAKTLTFLLFWIYSTLFFSLFFT